MKTSLYILTFLSCVGCIPLYLAFVRLRAKAQGQPDLDALVELLRQASIPTPEMVVLVPVLNEGAQIRTKLANLARQEYPEDRIEIWVLDGGSTDRTVEIVHQVARSSRRRIRLISCPVRGKIPQLNFALAQIGPSTIVAISDADSLIETEASLSMAARVLAFRPEIGLIGGFTEPPQIPGVPLSERAFWAFQNRMRSIESRTFSSNIVLAPLYLFRRALIREFPEDCCADDAHISFAAHALRLRVLYSTAIRVTENRFPADWMESFRHKLRKLQAYSLELVRFSRFLGSMELDSAAGCLFRAFFIFLWPWQVLYLTVRSAWFIGSHPLLAVSLGVMAAIQVQLWIRGFGSQLSLRSRIGAVLELGTALFSALLASVLTLPFKSQSSIYARVGGWVGETQKKSGPGGELPRPEPVACES